VAKARFLLGKNQKTDCSSFSLAPFISINARSMLSFALFTNLTVSGNLTAKPIDVIIITSSILILSKTCLQVIKKNFSNPGLEPLRQSEPAEEC
jgi:Na+-transporting NADH:ubiquinone oxidoreductase subunit NqrB